MHYNVSGNSKHQVNVPTLDLFSVSIRDTDILYFTFLLISEFWDIKVQSTWVLDWLFTASWMMWPAGEHEYLTDWPQPAGFRGMQVNMSTWMTGHSQLDCVACRWNWWRASHIWSKLLCWQNKYTGSSPKEAWYCLNFNLSIKTKLKVSTSRITSQEQYRALW